MCVCNDDDWNTLMVKRTATLIGKGRPHRAAPTGMYRVNATQSERQQAQAFYNEYLEYRDDKKPGEA